jgi:Family of unknown function (DUF6232)
MTIFYRGPCAYVTHEVFEVHYPYHRRFLIRDIRHPFLVLRPTDPGPPDRSVQVRARSASVAGTAAVAATLGWPAVTAAAMPPIATAGLVVGVVVVVSSVAFTAFRRIQPVRVYELWAVYHGQMTCLFDTTDKRVIGQVRRALVRAIERIEDG